MPLNQIVGSTEATGAIVDYAPAAAVDAVTAAPAVTYSQASGTLFRTRTGEITLHVQTYRMLAKAVTPLPAARLCAGLFSHKKFTFIIA